MVERTARADTRKYWGTVGMTWQRSHARLEPRQRIRWGNPVNEYKVLSVAFSGADVKCVKGPAKGRRVLISDCSDVERRVA